MLNTLLKKRSKQKPYLDYMKLECPVCSAKADSSPYVCTECLRTIHFVCTVPRGDEDPTLTIAMGFYHLRICKDCATGDM